MAISISPVGPVAAAFAAADVAPELVLQATDPDAESKRDNATTTGLKETVMASLAREKSKE